MNARGRCLKHQRDACTDPACLPPKGPAPKLFQPEAWASLHDADELEGVRWLWQPFVPEAAFVLLAAYMKSGKSTLAYALIAAMLRGDTFLGTPTQAIPVLLFSVEEHKRDVRRRLRRFGVPRDAQLYLQARPIPTSPLEWGALRAFIRAKGIKLIVLDTLARCWAAWGVADENDNARVLAALTPLLELTRDLEVTVLGLHHTGKLAQSHGREVRGASAILGLADQCLLLDRHRTGDRYDRVLQTLGRYEESPGELVIRFDPAHAAYSVVSEDAQASGAARLFPAVLTYLRRKGANGASLRDVRGNVTGRATAKDEALAALVDQGKAVLRDGRYLHADYDPQDATTEGTVSTVSHRVPDTPARDRVHRVPSRREGHGTRGHAEDPAA